MGGSGLTEKLQAVLMAGNVPSRDVKYAVSVLAVVVLALT